ncbi:MAG: MinD/ParA family protein [Balneolaceae bacterium]|nr:MAG: MinD/ParA family protein [Balneolaceae bacterium]
MPKNYFRKSKAMREKVNLDQPYIFTVTSGKGGVGKSMASTHLAEMLGAIGYKTALLDADVGLSNCATMMNESTGYTVTDWIAGDCLLDDLSQTVGSVTLVTASSDPGAMSVDSNTLMNALDQVVLNLMEKHDFIVIDTPAGAGEITLWALDRADTGVLLLVDEPAAISDVYRLCKYVYSMDPTFRFAAIVNFAESDTTAESTYLRFNHILDYFLKKEIRYLGFIPFSGKIRKALSDQRSIFSYDDSRELTTDFTFITQNIVADARAIQQQFANSINQL